MGHEWYNNYSLFYTKVLGKLACIVMSKPLGIGQAEHNWKEYKHHKKGTRNRLAPEKAKMQAIISGAYSEVKAMNRHNDAQRAGRLWNDDDYTWMKLDSYCTGSIIDRIKAPVRIVRCYEEEWEKVQFNYKGNTTHAARVAAKYGGLRFVDINKNPPRNGVVKDFNCTNSRK